MSKRGKGGRLTSRGGKQQAARRNRQIHPKVGRQKGAKARDWKQGQR